MLCTKDMRGALCNLPSPSCRAATSATSPHPPAVLQPLQPPLTLLPRCCCCTVCPQDEGDSSQPPDIRHAVFRLAVSLLKTVSQAQVCVLHGMLLAPSGRVRAHGGWRSALSRHVCVGLQAAPALVWNSGFAF